MVISQPAVICLEATAERVLRGLAAFGIGPGRRRAVATQPSPEPGVASEVAASETALEPPTAAPLTAIERRARAAALRGLLLARQRRFAAARSAFAEAVRFDPALDLTAIPSFWNLERGGHEAAVGAYEEAGRRREATALSARVRQTYRPRLVSSRRGVEPTAP